MIKDELTYEERNKRYRNIINVSLKDAIMCPDVPETLAKAMEYSLLAGGKRIRPCLTIGVCDIVNGNRKMAIKLACGIEMLHTYSLIHDDLPCMDNDDLRRGQPTNHKVFGEGQAMLAGDGLLTYAFQYMIEAGLSFGDYSYYRAVAEIARRAGICGMVAGQSMDLIGAANGIRNEDELKYIHKHKTADMLIAAILAGAYCGKTSEIQLKSLEAYGERIGMLFQITDDILDASGDSNILGKAVNKDEANNKLTYVTVYGMEKAKQIAESVAYEAKTILDEAFGEDCKYLYDMVDFIIGRSF